MSGHSIQDCDIVGHHVNSFNYLIDEGLQRAINDICPERFRMSNNENVEMWIKNASIGYPTLDTGAGKATSNTALDTMRILPSECRQRGITYSAKLSVTLCVTVNGQMLCETDKVVGQVPIMLGSRRCNLNCNDSKSLVRCGEEPNEKGGYFIVNGTEKVIRCLVLLRRNFPLALIRQRFRERGNLYTEFGVVIRSCKDSHSSCVMTLHYLESGTMTLSFGYRRENFFVPLIYVLKALINANDQAIFQALMRGRENDDFWRGCVANMFHLAQDDNIITRQKALEALGKKFRVAINYRIAPWQSDEDVGNFLLQQSVAIHLRNGEDKFQLLVYMTHKLVALVKGEILDESPDNPQFQEAGLSGHILLMVLKERAELWLSRLRRNLEIMSRKKSGQFVITSNTITQAQSTAKASEITRGLEYFLATGNLISVSGLGLGQQSGYSVIAERINYLRYVSHFRAIHRGSQFQDSRSSEVRKLRPEAWGFICPVHTPDGAPCGLLNHLTANCRVSTHLADTREMVKFLESRSLIRFSHCGTNFGSTGRLYPVLCDGKFIGYVPESSAKGIINELRSMKVNTKDKRVLSTLEITLIQFSPDPENIRTQFPGIYLFSEPGRLLRPVRNALIGETEFIGIFEQVYLSICIDPKEAEPGITQHQELAPNSLFSFSANLIPYPDHNQSPRNVYQCQMGKQTMGTPIHAWHTRVDNKMYRLRTPQSPLVKPEYYKVYKMDEYPLGTNAIVAVISYTGYDMEDAMIINKSSHERGFAHGSVYKCERLNVRDRDRKDYFSLKPESPDLQNFVDRDGLPIVGAVYTEGDPYCSIYNPDDQTYYIKKFKSTELAYVESVRVVSDESGAPAHYALIQWRIQRNPIIGDKFASRHGQKGINSLLWPVQDLPFTESGMVPDIIFNPHGFPSRMTIGMMIESMAGKAAAVHGWEQDATPFVFDEKRSAIEYFADLLIKAGYNYHGNETLYSGVDGRIFEAEIFFGVIYYQRLRHMIADKYQVRATGPVDTLTRQPVQGRKRAGGIRFGEMERDALISHGTAFIMQDRLVNCSDGDVAEVCKYCHSMLSTQPMQRYLDVDDDDAEQPFRATDRVLGCRTCGRKDGVRTIEIPYVFRYLTAELASMNIKTILKLHDVTEKISE